MPSPQQASAEPRDTGGLQFTRQQRLLLTIVPPLASFLLHLLGSTLRFKDRDAPGARPADRFPQEAEVYVFWHRALLLAAWRYRGLGIRILISASFDGELIARLVERLGFVPVRGSSSRGGAAGLLAATRARKAGYKVAITADGPRGPVYVAKDGAAAIAQRAHSSASCFHLHPESAWTLRSWDRFLIPKPFSRVRVAWQAPLEDPTTLSLQDSLNGAVRSAEA
ncbi:lysophospholipid acyltransferase family protein [Terriglobus roseus]|uniref:lysophospholipid acyltransferase family protein n=1 Tax=Terriglobus roseus TaxID=392734 RepID=UPI001FCD6F71|nr:lysophospholipid acyltransferase family protein [Terriglobus roseus]